MIVRDRVAGVKADHRGQHETDGLAVHDAEARGKRIGGGMSGAKHRIFDGRAGEGGAELHLAPCFQILRIAQHALEAGVAEPEGFARVDRGERAALLRHSGFERVRQRVNSSNDRDACRLRNREQWVENCNLCGGLGIATGHLLMRLLVGDKGKGLALAAGAGGGGNGDHRHERADELVSAPPLTTAGNSTLSEWTFPGG